MRYMVLLKMDESAGAPPAELVGAMGEAMQQAFSSGLMIDAGGLAPTAQSTEVRLRVPLEFAGGHFGIVNAYTPRRSEAAAPTFS